MAEEDIVVISEEMTDDDMRQLDEDFAALGEPPIVEEPPKAVVEEKPLTPEEEEDKKEDELHADKTPEEREAIRERRRQERKQKATYRKEKEDSYKREIESLRRELAEVNTWKNTVESRNVQSGIAQIDKAIVDSNEALELAKRAMSQATQDQNGEAFVEAQELYYAARKRGEDLTKVKQVIAKKMSQRPQQTLDPLVVQNAKNWMSTKTWYDVSGKDPDSRVTQTVERGLAEEGWDPRQPEYWQEVDNRLKKYLPHRFNVSYNEGNSSSRGEIPKPPTEGSSQGSGSKPNTGYRLSPDRVRAMKEAGIWDDPNKRRDMIKRYMDQDKQSKA